MINVEIFWNFDVGMQKNIFYFFHEAFSNSCGFPQFILFSRQLVFSDRKHFCSILTDLSNLSHIKWSSEFPFARL